MRLHIRKTTIIAITLLAACLFTQNAFPDEARKLYSQGLSLARRGDVDFAFARYHMLLENYPNVEFIDEVLFAVGEYYFSISNYYNAAALFNKLVIQYPESKAMPFVLSYLAKICRMENKESLAENLEKAIIRFKQTSLLFSNFKEYKYVSSFYKKYKAVYFIDRVEIYINDELFAKILL